MYGEIKLNDPKGEERTVPMLANAATLIRFKQLFHVDLLSGILDNHGNFDADIISKLGYVMAMQSAKADMNTLNYDKYIEWLEDFDSFAFIEKAQEIFEIYARSKDNSSEAKKAVAQPQES